MAAPAKHPTSLITHESLDGLGFGTSLADLHDLLGAPDKRARNYTGEEELLYGERIYRCLRDRFVEATFPDSGRLIVDAVEILHVYDWLGGLPDRVDVARFRISLSRGLAYDYRNPALGSITVFEAGHWDSLVKQSAARS